ncbi:heme peroxidase, partial [Trametes gibbosa]
LADVKYLSARPLPQAPDGRYDEQLKPLTDATKRDPHSYLYKVVTSLGKAVKHGSDIIEDVANLHTIEGFIDALNNKHAIDDRKLLFNTALAVLSRLPEQSAASKKLNDLLITALHETLPHPPATYVGTDYATKSPASSAYATPEAQPSAYGSAPRLPFAFRAADGSGNNPNMPNLGAARTPYARSVQNCHPVPSNVLPDSGDVFDMLLKARDFKPHPNGNSSLTFAYASIVTHQLFRTDLRDNTKNNTSSYFDLSVLYGNDQEEQNAIRDKASGRGLLYPDAFAEDRLGFLPPAATALLVLFSRNHNYIAEMILKINERGRWSDPPPKDRLRCDVQDEEIFQTARLINCGNFMAMIFGDYVAGFLGLGRDGVSWSLKPFDPITTPEGQVITRGHGNACSVEFNLLYRWHSTVAEQDIKWTEDLFSEVFKDSGKPLDKLDLKDFMQGAMRVMKTVEKDPRKRTFAGLQRGADARFSDDDLAKILLDATEKAGGAYRARGTPGVLRIIEILSIEQARNWGVCTMNEFRTFLGLKRYSTFEEWNPDLEVAKAARQLYGHIDNLELYTGLQAEETGPVAPGSGLCSGYTMMRAILSDAIALVRGDRFYTIEYTPANLTTWGFQDCARDPNNGAFGAALPKLLLRNLPRHYPADNIYGLYPMLTPAVTKTNLAKLGIAASYGVKRPVPQPIPIVVSSALDIQRILQGSQQYKTFENVIFTKKVKGLSVIPNLPRERQLVLKQTLFPSHSALRDHAVWLRTTTRKLIEEHSYQPDGLPGYRLDLVGNVINLAPVYWVSNFMLGIPLKTSESPRGVLTPQEVNDMLQLVFAATYLHTEPENNWSTSKRAAYCTQILTYFLENSLNEAAPQSAIPFVSSFLGRGRKPCSDFLSRIAHSKISRAEVVADVLGYAIVTAISVSKAVAQVVDFYLTDQHIQDLVEVTRLAAADSEDSAGLIRGYVREARLSNLALQFVPVLTPEGKPPSTSSPLLVLDLKNAIMNPCDFHDPHTVDPSRPDQAYQMMQDAIYSRYLGMVDIEEMVVEMVKVVFQLPNLQRVAGSPGTIGRVALKRFGVDCDQFINKIGLPDYFPCTLQVSVRIHGIFNERTLTSFDSMGRSLVWCANHEAPTSSSI